MVANPNRSRFARRSPWFLASSQPPTPFGSNHRGHLVLSNPIFAGALEGTAWHIFLKSN